MVRNLVSGERERKAGKGREGRGRQGLFAFRLRSPSLPSNSATPRCPRKGGHGVENRTRGGGSPGNDERQKRVPVQAKDGTARELDLLQRLWLSSPYEWGAKATHTTAVKGKAGACKR